MKNGIKIIRKSDQATQAVFIPEEIIQINRLNARIQRNIDAQQKAAADEQARQEAAQARQEAAQARQEAAQAEKVRKTLRSCVTMMAVGTAAWLAVPLELMAPVLALAVSLPCLCGICFQAGTLK
jgi:Flp pilus assembly protein TadB